MAKKSKQQLSKLAAKLCPVLHDVRETVRLFNSAAIQAEAVHGVRLIEPRNDLTHELRELTWCIATLNGMTTLQCPAGDDLIEASGAQRRLEAALLNPSRGMSR